MNMHVRLIGISELPEGVNFGLCALSHFSLCGPVMDWTWIGSSLCWMVMPDGSTKLSKTAKIS